MTPSHLAQYPFAFRLALSHLVDKIQLTSKNIEILIKDKDRIDLIVTANNPYQLRYSVDNHKHPKGKILILQHFKEMHCFLGHDTYAAAIMYIHEVQQYEASLQGS